MHNNLLIEPRLLADKFYFTNSYFCNAVFYVQSSVADITAVRTCLGKFKQIQKELYPTHYYRESRQWPQQCDIPNRSFKQTFVLDGHRFIIF